MDPLCDFADDDLFDSLCLSNNFIMDNYASELITPNAFDQLAAVTTATTATTTTNQEEKEAAACDVFLGQIADRQSTAAATKEEEKVIVTSNQVLKPPPTSSKLMYLLCAPTQPQKQPQQQQPSTSGAGGGRRKAANLKKPAAAPRRKPIPAPPAPPAPKKTPAEKKVFRFKKPNMPLLSSIKNEEPAAPVVAPVSEPPLSPEVLVNPMMDMVTPPSPPSSATVDRRSSPILSRGCAKKSVCVRPLSPVLGGKGVKKGLGKGKKRVFEDEEEEDQASGDWTNSQQCAIKKTFGVRDGLIQKLKDSESAVEDLKRQLVAAMDDVKKYKKLLKPFIFNLDS